MSRWMILALFWMQLYGDSMNWETPQTISTSGVNASSPMVSSDNSGNVVAVWIENGTVVASSLPYGGSWPMGPTAVSSPGVSEAEMVMDGNGNATAIWNLGGAIETSTLPLNGTWSTPVVLASAGCSSMQIAVDTLGNLAAIWVCNGVIQSAVRPINGSWSATPANISSGSVTSDSPSIDICKTGQLAAVWHQVVNHVDTIYASTSTLTGSWGAPVAISSPTYLCVNPKVSVNPKNGAIAVWYRYLLIGKNYSQVVVQASFLSAQGAWGTPTDISDAGMWNPTALMIKTQYNQNGVPVVMWNNSYDRINFSIEGSAYGRQVWLAPVQVIQRNLYAYDFDFSIASEGYLFGSLMMQDPSSGLPLVQNISSNTNAMNINYSDLTVISTGPSGYPRSTGRLLSNFIRYGCTVWLYFDGINQVVQAASGTGDLNPPPTNLAVQQNVTNLGIFTEYSNTISWSGISSEEICGFLIFRNGANIGSGPLSTTQFTDSNRQQNESIVYGVAFLEFDGDQTQVSTISVP